MPFDYDSYHTDLSFETLDLGGAPKIVITKHDVFSELHMQNIQVTYKMEEQYLVFKPLMLSATVFLFYIAAIIS